MVLCVAVQQGIVVHTHCHLGCAKFGLMSLDGRDRKALTAKIRSINNLEDGQFPTHTSPLHSHRYKGGIRQTGVALSCVKNDRMIDDRGSAMYCVEVDFTDTQALA